MEIIVVFVLLAGIMAFVGPKIWEQYIRAETKEAEMKLRHVAAQVEMYRVLVGRYPETLRELVTRPAGVDKWDGPYLKEVELKDRWGHDYKYAVPGQQGKKFDLVSFGADGKEGGDGENRDLVY